MRNSTITTAIPMQASRITYVEGSMKPSKMTSLSGGYDPYFFRLYSKIYG